MGRPENVRYENQFYRPRRVNNNGLYILFFVTVVLVITTIVLAVATLKKGKKDLKDPTSTSSSAEGIVTDDQGQTVDPTGIIVVTPTPTPAPAIEDYQNPILYPATAKMDVQIGTPKDEYTPSGRGVTQTIYNGNEKLSSYQRQDEIHFGDPLNYQEVGGILTFRGNNFRNCASWGTFSLDPAKTEHLELIWSYDKVGSVKGKAFPVWFGTLWTGQPVAVKWSYDVQQLMNLYPEKKSKQGLTEVIVAAGDGYVYFFDLEDGEKTRDPLKLGFTVKGTPAIDPRGYPILYVGQGDDNGEPGKIGFRIINLMNFEIMHFQCGIDSRSYRDTWGACDSSPIICAEADTLIYPNENGLIYTVKLNTQFNKDTGILSINPQTMAYKYVFGDISEKSLYGVESSMAIYDHYGWFTDNGGNLNCLDLNTLEMVWTRRLGDDSDVSPVIEEENGHVYLYTGTEVDWQKKDVYGAFQGASFTYKFDAMTGDLVWETSQDCWTYNDKNNANDVNGGMLGNPAIGKGKASNLVFFSYCMTKGQYRGDTVVAYDKSTGDVVWKHIVEFTEDPEHISDPYSWSSPVDVYDDEGNPYIMLCDYYGQVHLLDALTGDLVSCLRLKSATEPNGRINNIESSPIVIDGILVVGSRGQGIYGVKIS